MFSIRLGLSIFLLIFASKSYTHASENEYMQELKHELVQHEQDVRALFDFFSKLSVHDGSLGQEFLYFRKGHKAGNFQKLHRRLVNVKIELLKNLIQNLPARFDEFGERCYKVKLHETLGKENIESIQRKLSIGSLYPESRVDFLKKKYEYIFEERCNDWNKGSRDSLKLSVVWETDLHEKCQVSIREVWNKHKNFIENVDGLLICMQIYFDHVEYQMLAQHRVFNIPFSSKKIIRIKLSAKNLPEDTKRVQAVYYPFLNYYNFPENKWIECSYNISTRTISLNKLQIFQKDFSEKMLVALRRQNSQEEWEVFGFTKLFL